MKYSNGDFYDGEWANGLKHGQGVYQFNSGEVFEGTWLKDLINGEGVLTKKGGTVYNVFFEFGKMKHKIKRSLKL